MAIKSGEAEFKHNIATSKKERELKKVALGAQQWHGG